MTPADHLSRRQEYRVSELLNWLPGEGLESSESSSLYGMSTREAFCMMSNEPLLGKTFIKAERQARHGVSPSSKST